MHDLLVQGAELFDAGRYDLAETLFRKGLEHDPTSAVAHGYLSLCLTVRKKFDEGEREARQALDLSPASFFPHYALACCLHDSSRLIEASGEAVQAVELDPNHAPNYYLLARVRFSQGRIDEAREAAEEGLRLDPENIHCMSLRIDALRRSGREQEAQRASQELLRCYPDHTLSHTSAGLVLLGQSKFGLARAHFREALRLNPLAEVPLRAMASPTLRIPMLAAGLSGGVIASGSLLAWFIKGGQGPFETAQWLGFALAAIALLAPVPKGKAGGIKYAWILGSAGLLSIASWVADQAPGPEFLHPLQRGAFAIGVIATSVSPLVAVRLAWRR